MTWGLGGGVEVGAGGCRGRGTLRWVQGAGDIEVGAGGRERGGCRPGAGDIEGILRWVQGAGDIEVGASGGGR